VVGVPTGAGAETDAGSIDPTGAAALGETGIGAPSGIGVFGETAVGVPIGAGVGCPLGREPPSVAPAPIGWIGSKVTRAFPGSAPPVGCGAAGGSAPGAGPFGTNSLCVGSDDAEPIGAGRELSPLPMGGSRLPVVGFSSIGGVSPIGGSRVPVDAGGVGLAVGGSATGGGPAPPDGKGGRGVFPSAPMGSGRFAAGGIAGGLTVGEV
jgi:hypothetical protein